MSDEAPVKKMTGSERAALCQIVRKREKVMRSMASERSAALIAEFDRQSASLYSFDDNETWNKAFDQAKAACDEANNIIRLKCRDMGIPDEFAPALDTEWRERGQNDVKSRRQELRRMAMSRIAAMEKEALTKIERLSLQAQTEVLSTGIESEEARAFLGGLQSLESLMPELDVHVLKQLVDNKHKGED